MIKHMVLGNIRTRMGVTSKENGSMIYKRGKDRNSGTTAASMSEITISQKNRV
jgi:hypothetical protein